MRERQLRHLVRLPTLGGRCPVSQDLAPSHLVEVLGNRLATELRSGRRLKGHSTTMTESTASASAPGVPAAGDDAVTTSPSATTTFVLEPPRDPGTFSGSGDPDEVDVEDWLAEYERVSTRYRWGPTLMLANLLFYLRGTAKSWYENHETELVSWAVCREKMLDLFGKPIGRKMAANKMLASRAQTSTESYVSYIEDVLSLCRKANADMPEADKVGHILKGIADDAFNLLICKNFSTVDAIIKECRRFEQAKSRRINSVFTRLPNTAATSSCEERARTQPPPLDSSDQVTRIVRRELEAIASAPAHTAASDTTPLTANMVQAIVRQELASIGIPSVCALPSPQRASWRPPSSYHEQQFMAQSRDPAAWRTVDNRPICFHCHRIGHVVRYCNYRWSSPPRTSSQPHYRQDSTRFASAVQPSPQNNYRRFNSRSPSPHGHQSRSPPGRRQSSRSPQTRRPSSPFNPAPAYPEN